MGQQYSKWSKRYTRNACRASLFGARGRPPQPLAFRATTDATLKRRYLRPAYSSSSLSRWPDDGYLTAAILWLGVRR